MLYSDPMVDCIWQSMGNGRGFFVTTERLNGNKSTILYDCLKSAPMGAVLMALDVWFCQGPSPYFKSLSTIAVDNSWRY
jgi:hypothetical protein